MLHAVKVILASTIAGAFFSFLMICINAGWALVFYDKYQSMFEIEMIAKEVANNLFLGGFFGFLIAIIMLVRGDW